MITLFVQMSREAVTPLAQIWELNPELGKLKQGTGRRIRDGAAPAILGTDPGYLFLAYNRFGRNALFGRIRCSPHNADHESKSIRVANHTLTILAVVLAVQGITFCE